MKKIIYTIPAIIFLFAACSKTLNEDPKGSITSKTFYKTESDLQLAMSGISLEFNGAWNAAWSNTYGGDDISVYRGGNKIDFSNADIFSVTSSNTRMNNWWNYFYSAIKSANLLLANYQQADASDEQKGNVAGDAYFFRAVSYFFLTRTWGAVPMPLEFDIDNNRTNAEPADIYAQIVSDLQKAETMLPDHWDGIRQQNGIDILPTAGSAKALLANVYLTMAGWPLKQTDKYALAAAKAKEVIDNAGKWGYGLMPIDELWKYSNKFNKEAVFGCYFNNNVSQWSWENGNMMGPLSGAPDDEGGWTDGYGEISFYNKFPAGPRKEATYEMVYYPKNDPGNPVDYTKLQYKHPYFWKYRDDPSFNWTTHLASNWWGSATVYIIRYAEVLLTYAEAQAMATAPDASAYAAINQVRLRAGTPALQAGLSQNAFRDSVIAERGWEFAGAEPAARWFDLLRTETVGKANSDRDPAEPALVNKPDDKAHTFYWLPQPFNK